MGRKADDFSAQDVRNLKEKYPGVPVMIYINSYAEAKAECDVCCTSANAEQIALEMPGDEFIFVLLCSESGNGLRGKEENLVSWK